MVRAKMRCASIEGTEVTFYTQYDESIPEDQRFCKVTPWGEIKMGIDNPVALEQLKPGKDYYVDFTEVEGNV